MTLACRFFAGYRVRPDGIHFVMHADGRPSGMAFVEFDCPQEAMRALVRTLPLPVRCALGNMSASLLVILGFQSRHPEGPKGSAGIHHRHWYKNWTTLISKPTVSQHLNIVAAVVEMSRQQNCANA